MSCPDDSDKDIAVVLSAMTGRKLSREEVWKAMELPRSTYYDQLEKRTLITADNLRRAAGNLGINRAELLTRYRLIEPEEVAALAAQMTSTEGGQRPLSFPPLWTGVTRAARTRRTGTTHSPRRHELSAMTSTL
jgi:transcriptional regulator with XRE-family HTH domain